LDLNSTASGIGGARRLRRFTVALQARTGCSQISAHSTLKRHECRAPDAGNTRQKFLGGKEIRCYFNGMDSTTGFRHRKRGMTFLIISVVMLIVGETLLRSSLEKVPFLIYWTICFAFTGMAVLFAFLDVAGVQRQAREQQRELLEKTIREIARQKEAKAGRSASSKARQ
jgi:hypothetical protein